MPIAPHSSVACPMSAARHVVAVAALRLGPTFLSSLVLASLWVLLAVAVAVIVTQALGRTGWDGQEAVRQWIAPVPAMGSLLLRCSCAVFITQN